jgi:hypothetical protein
MIPQSAFSGNFTQEKGELCTIKTYSVSSANKTHGTRGVVYMGKSYDRVKRLYSSSLIISRRRPIGHRKFSLNAITKGGVIGAIDYELSICDENALITKNRSFTIRETLGRGQKTFKNIPNKVFIPFKHYG